MGREQLPHQLCIIWLTVLIHSMEKCVLYIHRNQTRDHTKHIVPKVRQDISPKLVLHNGKFANL
jgi:hypothetical protein